MPSAARLDTLIAGLAQLRGHFTASNEIHYALIADERDLAEIASADTAAIPKLVTCLRDLRPSRVERDGRRVPIAALCGHALLKTRYVQRGLQYDRFPRDWLGIAGLIPGVESTMLRAAEASWREWLTRGPLAWPP